jgi:hypothetical protein
MPDYPTAALPPIDAEPPYPQEPPPRHRRARLIALIAGVAVLVIGLPLGLMLGLRGDSGRLSAAPTAPSTAPGSTTPGSATPGSTAASPAPSPAPPGTRAAAAPDGRIPLAELKSATLTIPPWPTDNLSCPSGPTRFIEGEADFPPEGGRSWRWVRIIRVQNGDVDRDGAQETVVAISCAFQYAASEQLVAFDRDVSGRIVTLGTVVATTGPVRVIDDQTFQVQADGTVAVRVSDRWRNYGDQTQQQWQLRWYGWTGAEFRQTGGPTAFPVDPSLTETGVSTGELVFGPAADGIRHGTLTVTVTYLWGATPDHLTLAFAPPAGVERDGTAWPPVHPTSSSDFAVDVPSPARGTTRTYTFAFQRPAASVSGVEYTYVNLSGATRQGAGLSEANPYNNASLVTVRVVD